MGHRSGRGPRRGESNRRKRDERRGGEESGDGAPAMAATSTVCSSRQPGVARSYTRAFPSAEPMAQHAPKGGSCMAMETKGDVETMGDWYRTEAEARS